MKYAILTSGGKQYIAREGESIEVDRLALDVGNKVEFSDVLLTVDGDQVEVGKPTLAGAKVTGTVEDQIKGRKIIVFKYIPKERYRRKRGHRQRYTRVSIDKIKGPSKRKQADPEPAKAKSRGRKKAESEESGGQAQSTKSAAKRSQKK